MSELPRLISYYPSATDPVPAKEYNDLYITGLKLTTLEDLQQTLTIRLQNYNYDTKELSRDPSDMQAIFIRNLFEEVVRAPFLGYTMGMLITAISLIYQERELTRLIQEAEEAGEPTDELEAQLLAVQQQLGVV